MTVMASTEAIRVAQERRRGPSRLWFNLIGWIVVVALVGLWQLAAVLAHSYSISTFSGAVESLFEILTGPELLNDVVPSLLRTIIGFFGASIVGLLLGAIIGSSKALDPWVNPLLEFGRAIPPPLLVPIAILAIGFGEQLVIFMIVIGAFWPVLINTIEGIRRVEPQLLETATSLHIHGPTRAIRVTLMSAMPTIMAGLRVALGFSLILMVVTEMIGSSTGIAALLYNAQAQFRYSQIFGATLLLAIIGLTFDTLFVLVERRALKWHPSFHKEANV